MNYSFQLYSARNYAPWEPVFKTIAALGYSQVEGYSALYDDPAAMRTSLDNHNLTMPSGHFALDALENDLNNTLGTATTMGCTSVFCPYLIEDLRPTDLAGWQALAKRLQVIGEKVAGRGFKFGWHNHDFEFVRCADGTIPMQVILESAPDIDWEMDIAWVVRGDSDPQIWLNDYGARVTAIHVKDLASAGECVDEDGWADVGFGTMDWAALANLISKHTNASLFIAEHDNPNDYERFARRSIETMKSFA